VGPTDHETAKSQGSSSSSGGKILPGLYMRLQYPAVMGISVYMDDNGVIDKQSWA
jgi:hypothetical protein